VDRGTNASSQLGSLVRLTTNGASCQYSLESRSLDFLVPGDALYQGPLTYWCQYFDEPRYQFNDKPINPVIEASEGPMNQGNKLNSSHGQLESWDQDTLPNW
jgi:hypothetical protein